MDTTKYPEPVFRISKLAIAINAAIRYEQFITELEIERKRQVALQNKK